ncbi:MAG TPA: acetyl-CoA C-acyltransferase, partial [Bryobacteraceae bacterium]|nr:acetyl-CoA C-acyltransferase [Bryobacteraceae bacterium]
SDPFEDVHMGITAEYIAKKFNITRREQDEFAVESNRRAIEAIKHCLFQEQIVPIELKTKTGTTVFDTDEHPRADATLENLAKLKPAFDRNGTVTAGNASGLNDGAAAVVLMERKKAEDRGLKPLARLAGYAFAGVEPRYMGIGPVPAVRNLLKKTGIKLEDVAVIEANEAFAVQALAVMRELGLPPERTNPNGGAVALGHPIGASGAIITVKALHELRRIEGRYAMATLCIGGGQGIAAMFERLPN